MRSSTAEPFLERSKNNNSVGLSMEHLTRCESNGQLLGDDLQAAQNRYFLHHHSPTHHNVVMRRLGSLGDHLQRLQRHNRNHFLKHGRKVHYASVDGAHIGLRLVKSGIDISYSASAVSVQSHARPYDPEFSLFPTVAGMDAVDDTLISGAHVQVVRGHELVPATCSRFSGKCEACRHTVHATKYSYCRNCPTVCHNSKNCLGLLQRPCPALNLGVFGWGEGTQTTLVNLQKELDLEFVFLGGTKPLVVNECAECGRVLERRLGYACDQEVSVTAAKHRRMEKKRKEHKWHLEKEKQEEEENRQKEKTQELHGETVAAEGTVNGHVQSHRPHRRLRSLLPALVAGEVHFGRMETQQQQVAKRVLACHYTGRYFCERCHWGDEWYIPGCIFILNDCEKHPVSRTAYLKLRVLWETAVIRAPPYWYHDNEEAAKNSQAPHLLGQPHLLRMADVVDILSKTLYPRLEKKFQLIDSHIRECRMCRSVNRLCCACKRGKSLFSYDENVGVCRICDKVFHLSCSEVTNLCPVCDTAVRRLPSA
uniref:Rubicon Homology domain-containing protein n=1 Tax=Schistocephalus solidus TaxID=70667 RepID=A0A0X3PZ73_SCHSO